MDYCNTSITPDYKKNDEEHEFIIRVFNERYNMDRSYYEGSSDIKFAVRATDPLVLMELWFALEVTNEGETYCVWKDGKNIMGGAWDPDDWTCIASVCGLSIDDIKSRDFYKDYVAIRRELTPIIYVRNLRRCLEEKIRKISVKKEV